jgi:hypothetical protein
MVRSGDLSVEVCIGGAAVEEFEHGGSTYIECNLMHEKSYKVPLKENDTSEDVAMWPVTPYTVKIQNLDKWSDAQHGTAPRDRQGNSTGSGPPCSSTAA